MFPLEEEKSHQDSASSTTAQVSPQLAKEE